MGQITMKVKLLQTWHVTCATHNSRYSQRMYDHHLKRGPSVWLSNKEEIIVTETIADIVQKDSLKILAYNICGDHMHLILVCEPEELPKIVQKIKSMCARACNIAMGRTIPGAAEEGMGTTREHAPFSGHGTCPEKRGTTSSTLWTQKFGRSLITSERYLENAIAYVRNNRIKHGLPPLGGNGNANMEECSRVRLLVEKITCNISEDVKTV